MQGHQPGLRRLSRALGAVIVWLALGATAGAGEATAPLPLISQTIVDAPLVRRAPYNYAPAIIHDGALYHLYWCAGDGGDVIMHLQAPALAGPWTAAGAFWSRRDVVLRPTRSAADFDGLHTCDPNVLKIGDTFYLYYTGEAKDGALSAIGVAASQDAVHFARLGNGPIVVASEGNAGWRANGLTYGAGQPAVAYRAPWIYLSFTDSTGADGDGQYLLRSKDPGFEREVEEWTRTGWQRRSPRSRTGERSWLDSYGLDLMYDPPSRLLLAVTDRLAGRATVLAIDPETMRPRLSGDLRLAWREGPSFVAEAGKTTAPRPRCGDIDVAVAAAAGTSESPLSWGAIDYSAGTFSLASACHP